MNTEQREALDGVETELVVVASTSHLTEAEAKKLNSPFPELPIRVIRSVWDALFLLPQVGDDGTDPVAGADWSDWPGLHAVYDWCRSVGVTRIRLDRDADPIDGLEVHEW